MGYADQIIFAPGWLALIGALLAYIVWSGRPEWGLGIYLSLTLWTRTVMFGPIAHTWVLLATTVAAVAVHLFRTKKPLGSIVPPNGRWIMIWMMLWWAWMTILIGVYDADNKRDFMRPLILYVMLPLPIVLVFAKDLERVRGFAAAFIATTLIGGWQAMAIINITLDYLATDPTLTRLGIIRLGLANYHWFAYGFAISLLLCIGLFLQTRRLLVGALLLACAAYCVYFIFLAGSRQSLNGAGATALLMVAWSLYRRGTPKARVGAIAGLVVAVGLLLFQMAPNLILRNNETDYSDTFDLLSDRGGLWAKGWEIFMSSPIWGTGFEYSVYAHNLFLSTLADQGIVGFVFLLGFLVFFTLRSRGVWAGRGPQETAIWRLTFMSIGLFGLIHSQASNDSISVWHLYWSTAFLWWLGQGLEERPVVIPAIKQKVLALREARRARLALGRQG